MCESKDFRVVIVKVFGHFDVWAVICSGCLYNITLMSVTHLVELTGSTAAVSGASSVLQLLVLQQTSSRHADVTNSELQLMMTVKLGRTWTCRRDSANAACCCGVQEYRDASQPNERLNSAPRPAALHWCRPTGLWHSLTVDTSCVTTCAAAARSLTYPSMPAALLWAEARSVGRTMRGMASGTSATLPTHLSSTSNSSCSSSRTASVTVA